MIGEFVIGASSDSGLCVTNHTPIYQSDNVNGDGTLLYNRWENRTDSQLIQKVSVSANITTVQYARGLWANRASLTYQP